MGFANELFILRNKLTISFPYVIIYRRLSIENNILIDILNCKKGRCALKRSIFIYLFIIATLLLYQDSIYSSTKGKKITSSIARGVYVCENLVTVHIIKTLPVPRTNKDYMFYQSIGKTSNIIIGSFKVGERKITVITDTNADGKVDLAAQWFVDLNDVRIEGKPEIFCKPEEFLKMKEDVARGESDKFFPNAEGTPYLKVLIKTASNIVRKKNGFLVVAMDVDEPSKNRVSYFFSNKGVYGTDIVFTVYYYNVRTSRVSPIINTSIYCRKSFDPFAIKLSKELIKETNKYRYDFN